MYKQAIDQTQDKREGDRAPNCLLHCCVFHPTHLLYARLDHRQSLKYTLKQSKPIFTKLMSSHSNQLALECLQVRACDATEKTNDEPVNLGEKLRWRHALLSGVRCQASQTWHKINDNDTPMLYQDMPRSPCAVRHKSRGGTLERGKCCATGQWTQWL